MAEIVSLNAVPAVWVPGVGTVNEFKVLAFTPKLVEPLRVGVEADAVRVVLATASYTAIVDAVPTPLAKVTDVALLG
jgi:hypothetical protein